MSVLFLILISPSIVSAEADYLISYVMEPFDITNRSDLGVVNSIEVQGLPKGIAGTEFSVNDTLYGTSSFGINYNNSGFQSNHIYALQSILPDKVGQEEYKDLQLSPVYMCWGAKQISFSYKHTLLSEDVDNDLQWRFTLFDSTNCRKNCTDPENLEAWDYVGDLVTADNSWKTVTMPFDDGGWKLANSPSGSDRILNLAMIKGWRLQLTSATVGLAGRFLLDQIVLDGPGEMLGAAFYANSWNTALVHDVVQPIYYNSNISKSRTVQEVGNGDFSIDYTAQQTETWGGFIQYDFTLPSRAYYNLSKAQAITMNYHVRQNSSAENRAHVRVVVLDSSGCLNETCGIHGSPLLENYYSFHYILDQVNKSGYISIELKGSDDSASPLWRTGWFGAVGNNLFDKSRLKGFKVEISLDSQGDKGSMVYGAFQLSDLMAAEKFNSSLGVDSSRCLVEPNLLLIIRNDTNFKRIEFLNFGACCYNCMLDDACIYALDDGRDCYKVFNVTLSNVALTLGNDSSTVVFTKKSTADFCTVCECRQFDRTIDCRGRDLVVLPSTFTPLEQDILVGGTPTWRPLVLDLRQNPRLLVLGIDSLSEILSIEELRLPSHIVHISPETLKDLSNLKSLSFEDPEASSFSNFVTSRSASYSDVCCGMGEQVNFPAASPVRSLSFCDMKPDQPGIDSVYIPFYEFYNGGFIVDLFPSSKFMAEAAESEQKCAEYCSIRSDCRYFTYDNRIVNTEPVCHLLTSIGTPSFVCCQKQHYADVNMTRAGFISGWVPRTRYYKYGARVLLTQDPNIALTQSSGYKTSYQLALGSMPFRGAVWVEPRVVSSTLSNNVVFSPSRVVFYDNTTAATVWVTLEGNLVIGGSFVVENVVKSCDKAFSIDNANLTVYVQLIVPYQENKTYLWVSVGVCGGVIIVLVIAFAWYLERKKKQSDYIWHIQASELVFGDPPKVIGYGSFGLVLLAEYRGTEVAVKRVIPPRRAKGSKSSTGPASVVKMLKMFDFSDGDAGDNSWNGLEGSISNSAADVELGNLPSTKGERSGGLKAAGGKYQTKFWLKALQNQNRDYSKLKEDFVEEMRHLSKLRHPCITTVMGAVINPHEEPMLVMEYMDYGSLFDLLRNKSVDLQGEEILLILRDIAQGLRYLHAANPQVIHGDLKARNILVDSRLRAKVADFGLSQKKNLGACGTPYWMAPELLRGETSNTTFSDVYAFGIILFEVYERKNPYEGEDFVETLDKVCDPKINKRPAMPEACPPTIADMLNGCLDADPGKRPTFKELDLRLKSLDAAKVDPVGTPRSSFATRVTGLLEEVFPRHIAKALREGKKIEPETREMVTIFFSDIVGFTRISECLSAMAVSDMLDRLYVKFDEISRKHDVYKVETIGDSWMGVTNLIKPQPDHADRIAAFALDAMQAAHETLIDPADKNKGFLNLRIGFHSGPVVANVVGSRNPRYCLFGDTVNTASRMESHALPGRIQCSEASAELLRNEYIDVRITSRGKISIKGKGQMVTYWVEDRQSPSNFPDETDPKESAVDSVNEKRTESETSGIDVSKGEGNRSPSIRRSNRAPPESALKSDGNKRNSFAAVLGNGVSDLVRQENRRRSIPQLKSNSANVPS